MKIQHTIVSCDVSEANEVARETMCVPVCPQSQPTTNRGRSRSGAWHIVFRVSVRHRVYYGSRGTKTSSPSTRTWLRTRDVPLRRLIFRRRVPFTLSPCCRTVMGTPSRAAMRVLRADQKVDGEYIGG